MKKSKITVLDDEDIKVECQDCGKEFNHSVSEQILFEKLGYNIPKRCQECRKKKKARNIRYNTILQNSAGIDC